MVETDRAINARPAASKFPAIVEMYLGTLIDRMLQHKE